MKQQERSTQEDNKAPMKGRRLEHWQIISLALMLYDFVAVCGSYFLALFLRFDCVYSAIPQEFIVPYNRFILPYGVGCIGVFLLAKMYNSVWRYASYTKFVRTLAGSLLTSVAHTVLITVLLQRMPISYYMMGAFFQFVFLIGARFGFRFIRIFRLRHETASANGKSIMMIGAGNAAQMILREMTMATEISDRVVCIIDDNPNKWHRYLSGIPIVGGRDEILSAVEKYHVDEIYLAIPGATAEEKRDILAICSETNCKLSNCQGSTSSWWARSQSAP